jgi:hypothetical protein
MRRSLLERNNKTDKKTSLGAMSFVETFADLVIQLSSRFLQFRDVTSG